MGYKHLTKEQRYTIMVLLQAQATISRELDIQFYFASYKTPLEYCKTMFNFDFEKVAL